VYQSVTLQFASKFDYTLYTIAFIDREFKSDTVSLYFWMERNYNYSKTQSWS